MMKGNFPWTCRIKWSEEYSSPFTTKNSCVLISPWRRTMGSMKRSLLPPFALLSLVHSGYSHYYYICFCLAFCSTSRISSAPLPVIHISHPWFINEWTLVLGLSQRLSRTMLCVPIFYHSQRVCKIEAKKLQFSCIAFLMQCNKTRSKAALAHCVQCSWVFYFVFYVWRSKK